MKMQKYIFGSILVLVLLFGGFLYLDSLIVRRVKSQIYVGMPLYELTDLYGAPSRVTLKGQPLDPPHVSGFTPTTVVSNRAYTYFYYRLIIYVLIDSNDKVEAVFVCEP